jgi:MarR family transcriptional regulator, organic hydroperoxide resistance regulator
MYTEHLMSTRSPSRGEAASAVGAEALSGFALWRKAMRWQRGINATLRPLRLTHTQFLVLASLDRARREVGDAVTQRAIATEAGLDEATTSSVLQALERRGMVDRGPTHGDARAWRVIVASPGQRVLRQAAPLVDAASQRFFDTRSGDR